MYEFYKFWSIKYLCIYISIYGFLSRTNKILCIRYKVISITFLLLRFSAENNNHLYLFVDFRYLNKGN